MITVCIPAFRAGSFIAETVGSVLAQSFDDFLVSIAIDPSDDGPDDTKTALEPFRDDPRVSVRVNWRRLGWAQNFNSLLETVKTDFFAFLPHDDLWTPNYLATLAPLVMADASASVSFADMRFFGAAAPDQRHAMPLPKGESRTRHLLRFMIEGAHAVPWRGVTRRSVSEVTGGFPYDGFGGFAVEAEYALSLLEAGIAIHVASPLYRKRVFGADQRVSASASRLARPIKELALAWNRHRNALHTRMVRMLRQYPCQNTEAVLTHDAFLAAMLNRRRSMVAPGITPSERRRLNAAIARAAASDDPLAARVALELQTALVPTDYCLLAEAR